jgi:hypoxanthine phosphoribosyltransferase
MDAMKREVLFTETQIDERVQELAECISMDYEGKELIIIGVLKGAFIFLADIVRYLRVSCQVDFIWLSSYGASSSSSGRIIIKKDIEMSITGKDVLVVEDIVDTGITLSFLMDCLRRRQPRSLKACVFLDKYERRKIPFKADYVGFSIDGGFVVGYGLDFNERGRFLPDVCRIVE